MRTIFWLIPILLSQLVFAEAVAKNIRIVSTTNVHGETDPCG
tara:strand:+ start:120 stop:245 length:126 start_codon:yes stop_codon:yes gene_type:complete